MADEEKNQNEEEITEAPAEEEETPLAEEPVQCRDHRQRHAHDFR